VIGHGKHRDGLLPSLAEKIALELSDESFLARLFQISCETYRQIRAALIFLYPREA
jgi:hypothetical protein